MADWTEDENRAVVEAYFQLLDAELAGSPLVKAHVNQELRDGPLASRSHGSVEFKLQNISAVLRDEGLPWVAGYKPRGHKQDALRAVVLAAAQQRSLTAATPTADEQQANIRAGALLQREEPLERPSGQARPGRVASKVELVLRDPTVRAWVEQEAGGHCELCGQVAPFRRADGRPFLEVHHPHRLGDGGPDVVENAVALCPTCHRRLHHGEDALAQLERLYLLVPRLVRSGAAASQTDDATEEAEN